MGEQKRRDVYSPLRGHAMCDDVFSVSGLSRYTQTGVPEAMRYALNCLKFVRIVVAEEVDDWIDHHPTWALCAVMAALYAVLFWMTWEEFGRR